MKKIFPALTMVATMVVYAAPNEKEELNNIKSKLVDISAEQFSNVRIEPSIIDGFYQVVSPDGGKVYVNKDVKAFFSGDLISIGDDGDLKNVTAQENRKRNKAIIDNLDLKYNQSLVHYPTTAKEKVATVYVFMDYTCPFCKRLNQSRDDFSKNGVEFYYIPFPRNSMEDIKAVKGLQKIMCAQDKREAFDEAFKNPKTYASVKDVISCGNAIDILNIHNYTDLLGIKGTPTAFTANGTKIVGFNSAEEFALSLRRAIEDEKKWKKDK